VSQENVQLVRRMLNEFIEKQQLSDLVSPEFVWHVGSSSAWTGRSEFHGRDGFMEFFGEWTDAYDEWTLEAESMIDAGDGHVVVTARQQGRLRGSESWVALRAGLLYTVENGLLVPRYTRAPRKPSKPPGSRGRRFHSGPQASGASAARRITATDRASPQSGHTRRRVQERRAWPAEHRYSRSSPMIRRPPLDGE
jgi:ketosteroid isomerase-like protein